MTGLPRRPRACRPGHPCRPTALDAPNRAPTFAHGPRGRQASTPWPSGTSCRPVGQRRASWAATGGGRLRRHGTARRAPHEIRETRCQIGATVFARRGAPKRKSCNDTTSRNVPRPAVRPPRWDSYSSTYAWRLGNIAPERRARKRAVFASKPVRRNGFRNHPHSVAETQRYLSPPVHRYYRGGANGGGHAEQPRSETHFLAGRGKSPGGQVTRPPPARAAVAADVPPWVSWTRNWW